MKIVRNEKIVSILIDINLVYEKKLEAFPFKHDVGAVFEFECAHYVNILSEKVVPLIAQYLDQNPNESLETYAQYVNAKYRSTFIDDVKRWKKNEVDVTKNLSRQIIKDFSLNVVQFVQRSDQQKNDFIVSFLQNHEQALIQICRSDSELLLYTVSQLANPRIQYTILNVLNKEIATSCKLLLTNVNGNFFDKMIINLCCYPMDISMEDYCKKWIGKDKIYVKFLKNILADKYEYAKLLIKLEAKNKTKKTLVAEH